ncbi:MAG: 6-bladed beta-propeller [Acidobacteriota bacterium]|nr:6-bladed beta-propeller [Acidobacteriota bacterium]
MIPSLLLVLVSLDLEIAGDPVLDIPGVYGLQGFDSQGKIIVLALKISPNVRLFDQKGQLLRKWGRRGQGPGDFTNVKDVAIIDDSIWVLNKIPNKVVVFSLSGVFIREVRLDCRHVVRMEAGQGNVFIQDGGWFTPDNTLLRFDGKAVSRVRSIDLGKTETLTANGMPPLTIPSPFAHRDHWIVLDDGKIAYYSKNDRAFLFLNFDGSVIETLPFKPEEYQVTKSSFDLWLNRTLPRTGKNISFPTRGWRKLAADLIPPRHYPPVLDLIAEGGKLWIQRGYQREHQLWERYDKKKQTGTMMAPSHYQIIGFKAGRAFFVESREDDDFFVSAGLKSVNKQ